MPIQIRIRIRILPRVLHMLENQKFSSEFYSQQCHASLHCFFFLINVIGVIIFSILDSKLEFLEKYSSPLQLVKIDTDPDPDLAK
jgi:hypothetical protein